MSDKQSLITMLDLHKLEVFLQVAQAGSFRAAAERLFITQPGVSQHIQDLERSLGRPLFHRGPKGVTLTLEGRTLRDYAERILALVVEAQAAITTLDPQAAGQVRIGATPGVSGYLLPGWIHAFSERFPAMAVALQTGTTPEIVARLIARQIDLGFIEGDLDPALAGQLEAVLVSEVAQRIVIGPKHPLWARPSIQFAELDGAACITRQAGSQSRIWLEGVLREQGIRPRIVAEFDNLEAIKHSVRAGVAFSVLPAYAVLADLHSGALGSPETGVALCRALRAVSNAGAPLPPIARAFLAAAMPDQV